MVAPHTDWNASTTIRSDVRGVVRHWGAEIEALLGYTAEEATGESVQLIIPEPLRAWHWRGFDKAVTTGVLHKPDAVVRVPAVHRDGHLVAIKGEIGLTRDDAGSVVGAEVMNVQADAAWMASVWRPVVGLVGLAGRVGLRPSRTSPNVDH